MDLKIQKLEYAHEAWVEYVVRDDVVIYCGVSNIRQLPEEASTTNAALDILRALAKAIGKSVDALTFFELSTYTSWIFKPGEYDFHSVKSYREKRREVVRLVRTQAPKAILEAFRRRIGGDAIRKYTPDVDDTPEEADVA